MGSLFQTVSTQKVYWQPFTPTRFFITIILQPEAKLSPRFGRCHQVSPEQLRAR